MQDYPGSNGHGLCEDTPPAEACQAALRKRTRLLPPFGSNAGFASALPDRQRAGVIQAETRCLVPSGCGRFVAHVLPPLLCQAITNLWLVVARLYCRNRSA